jgi:hypothetical protein
VQVLYCAVMGRQAVGPSRECYMVSCRVHQTRCRLGNHTLLLGTHNILPLSHRGACMTPRGCQSHLLRFHSCCFFLQLLQLALEVLHLLECTTASHFSFLFVFAFYFIFLVFLVGAGPHAHRVRPPPDRSAAADNPQQKQVVLEEL